MDPHRRGRWGEELAAGFLTAGGYRILARNYRTRWGELDLVAARREQLFAVEVKAWQSRRFGPPEGHLGPYRLQRLRRAITHYLALHGGGFQTIHFAFVFIHVQATTLQLRFLRQA